MKLKAVAAKPDALPQELMAKHVINATKDVFSTMVTMDIQDNFPLRESVTKFHCCVTGMVGFGGIYSGVLAIHCPQDLAMAITSNMVGMEVDEVGEDVHDALGEIANMLGGHVKMVLSKRGQDINISIPTVICGEEYTINSISESDCVIVPFSTDGGPRFLVSLKLKKE